MKNEKVYLVTDGCFWEINKETGNEHPHSIEVVDIDTGAVRYIRSGSKISFIDGEITDIRTQKAYNVASKEMSSDEQNLSDRKAGKRSSKKSSVQKRKGV